MHEFEQIMYIMAEAMDETGPFMILEDYFDDEQLEISFSNMSIDGEYHFSGLVFYKIYI